MGKNLNAIKTKKITLFLMTEKGYFFLNQTLKKYKHLYKVVVIGSDKNTQNDFEKEIIELCILNNINYIRKVDFQRVETEYVISISWRWLIDHPKRKLIIFHDSILPRYRGFAPLVNSLINGEVQIGVSAIFGEGDYDAGNIIIQSKSSISYPLTIGEAIKIVNTNYLYCANFILDIIDNSNELIGTPQEESEASYSIWRDESDYLIDWNKSSKEIRRFIDSTGYPYKCAKTYLNGDIVRIISAEESTEIKLETRHTGKVIFIHQGKPVIICGEGTLIINEGYIEEKGIMRPLIPLPYFRVRFIS